jgi:hypothetical protein
MVDAFAEQVVVVPKLKVLGEQVTLTVGVTR